MSFYFSFILFRKNSYSFNLILFRFYFYDYSFILFYYFFYFILLKCIIWGKMYPDNVFADSLMNLLILFLLFAR